MQSQIVPESSMEGGNTITPSKKQIAPSKRWCFTFNNYTKDDISSIVPILDSECKFYIVAAEVGKVCETPHLQGYVEFTCKVRPKNMFSTKIHWEKCRGNRNDNVEYCSKDGNIIASKGLPVKPITISRDDFYEWQEEMVQILENPCPWDDRRIYWRHGRANIGKTQFAKWLCVHLGACVIGGEARHMLAQVQNTEAPIYVVLLSYGDEKVSYRAIEQIKDGLFTSHFGTDNNKQTIRNSAHVIVLGNEAPDEEDRHFHPGKYDVDEVNSSY